MTDPTDHQETKLFILYNTIYNFRIDILNLFVNMT